VSTKRFLGAVRRKAGWKPGEVSFAEDYTPIPLKTLSPMDLHALHAAHVKPTSASSTTTATSTSSHTEAEAA